MAEQQHGNYGPSKHNIPPDAGRSNFQSATNDYRTAVNQGVPPPPGVVRPGPMRGSMRPYVFVFGTLALMSLVGVYQYNTVVLPTTPQTKTPHERDMLDKQPRPH